MMTQMMNLDLKELDDDTNEVFLDNFMASTAQAGKPEELILNILPRFGESVMNMPREPLMSLPKHPLRTDDPTLLKKLLHQWQDAKVQEDKDYFFMDTFFAT